MKRINQSLYKSEINSDWITEELTISVGQGSGGINTSIQIPATSKVVEVSVVVSQAPGSGAATFNLGRTSGGNTDEFLQNISSVLGTSGSFVQGDGDATPNPLYNATADTLVLTTATDVATSDMKVKISVFYEQFIKPSN